MEVDENKQAEDSTRSHKVVEIQTSVGTVAISSTIGIAATPPSQSRAVARKSTSKKPSTPEATAVVAPLDVGSNTKPSHSIVVSFEENLLRILAWESRDTERSISVSVLPDPEQDSHPQIRSS